MNTESLTSIGISEKAAKVYLAGLTLGTTSVQELSRKTRIKRSTVYLQLDELFERGLFERVVLNNKQYYRAVEPTAIEDQLKKSLSTLQAAMSDMMALPAMTPGKPQVRVFEGAEGVKRVYEEMQHANSWRVWSNLGKIYPLFGDTYEKITEAVRHYGIGVREITTDTKETRRYQRLLAKMAGPTYTVRFATVEGLENDTIIYGNVVAIFRIHEFNTFVVRIEDKTIADSMKAMFEMAWKSAKLFK